MSEPIVYMVPPPALLIELDSGHWLLRSRGRRTAAQPESARVLGLKDRVALRVGMCADVNVLGPAAVAEHQPEQVHDFAGGALHYIQKSLGFKAIIANDAVTLEGGKHTSERAGKLLWYAS